MLIAADGGQVSATCLLDFNDLSAASDMVDHERQFGLRCVRLQ